MTKMKEVEITLLRWGPIYRRVRSFAWEPFFWHYHVKIFSLINHSKLFRVLLSTWNHILSDGTCIDGLNERETGTGRVAAESFPFRTGETSGCLRLYQPHRIQERNMPRFSVTKNSAIISYGYLNKRLTSSLHYSAMTCSPFGSQTNNSFDLNR